MPRTARCAVGGLVYHVLNRGSGRLQVFRKPGDFLAFVDLMIEAKEHAQIEVFGYCVMSNHWHMVVRPRRDRDLAGYFSWLTNTHVKRYRAHYRRTSGHLYQGRYKSFAVEEDGYLLTLLRYVEANPLRAKLVARAEDWAWSSLSPQAVRDGLVEVVRPKLAPWPRDAKWHEAVNAPLEAARLDLLRRSVVRGTPFGLPEWVGQLIADAGMESTVRSRGRPRQLTTDE